MRVYVASKFGNRERVRDCYALLRANGHEITYAWVDDDQKCGAQGVDANFIPNDRKIAAELAMADFRGVLDADALIFLTIESGGRGCFTELGLALMNTGMPIATVGPHLNSIFMFMPGVTHLETIEQVPDWLKSLSSATGMSYLEARRILEAHRIPGK